MDLHSVVIEKLTGFAQETQDVELSAAGADVFRSVRASLEAAVPNPADVQLLFPGMIVRPDVRTDCLALVLTDRVLIAWTTGLLRKRPVVISIEKSSIDRVSIDRGADRATSGATVLTIQAAGSRTTVALAQGSEPVHQRILEAVERRAV